MVQTRSESTGLKEHTNLIAAFDYAKNDNSVWKISFNTEDGTRIRLVRYSNNNNEWRYQSLSGHED